MHERVINELNYMLYLCQLLKKTYTKQLLYDFKPMYFRLIGKSVSSITEELLVGHIFPVGMYVNYIFFLHDQLG